MGDHPTSQNGRIPVMLPKSFFFNNKNLFLLPLLWCLGCCYLGCYWPSFGGQCTVEKKEYFARLSAAMKIDLPLEIQYLPKCPFLNVFSKIYCPTKVDVLGNWEVSILFRNLLRFFFCFYWGSLNWLCISLKWHQSWRHHMIQAVSMNWPALLWQLLKLFPVVS